MSHFVNDRGRGTVCQPGNRFEKLSLEIDDGAMEEIAAANQRIENAKKGGRPPKSSKNAPKTLQKRFESEAEFVQNQTLNQNTPSPSPSKKERSASRYAFKGKVIKLLADDLSTWRKVYHF